MRILHLEDDNPLREVLKAAILALEPLSELHQFSTSDSALEYIERNGKVIDLFILDIRVPGAVDGIGVAQKIRDLNCPGNVIITSAYRKPDQNLLMALNCKWYAKPWHIIEIQDALTLAKRHVALLQVPKKNEPPSL